MRTPAAPLLCIALAAALVGACSAEPPTNDSLATDAAASARPTRSLAPPDPSAIAEAAAFGTWRPAPIAPTPDLATAMEQACRADPAVGDLPLRVLDARGLGLATLVFAGDDGAVLCRTSTDEATGTVTAVARAVAGSRDAATPEARTLGIHDLEVVDETTNPRVVLVGMVGDGAHTVEVNHDDATWTKARMDNGWYAVWWPLAKEAIGVAAVDTRSTVIDSYPP